MCKPKILIVSELPPKPGGIAATVRHILTSGPINGAFELCTLELSNSSTFSQTEKRALSVHGILRRLIFLCRLVYTAIATKSHMVHYNISADMSFLSDLLNLAVLKLLGRKVIFHYHNDPTSSYSLFPSSSYWRSFLFRLGLRWCDLFIVIGDRYRESLEKRFGGANKISVVTNAIPHQLPVISRVSTERPLQALFMGRLSRLKGIYHVIEAAHRCDDAKIPVYFTVAGYFNTKRDEEDVAALVSSYRLKNLTFAGVVSGDSKHQLFMKSELLLFPSSYESFGVTVLEAAVYQIPALVFDVGMMRSIVVHGQTGYILPVGDVASLFSMIAVLESNRPHLLTMGREARIHVETKFDSHFFEEALLDCYRRISEATGNA